MSLLLARECVSCHTGNANALVFDLHQSPAVLVGVPSPSESCGGTLVVLGDPARSYLFAKIRSAARSVNAVMTATYWEAG